MVGVTPSTRAGAENVLGDDVCASQSVIVVIAIMEMTNKKMPLIIFFIIRFWLKAAVIDIESNSSIQNYR
jgi:hypothetical protein